jgi:hypothetical protein
MEAAESAQELERDPEESRQLRKTALRAREKSSLVGGDGLHGVGRFHDSNIPRDVVEAPLAAAIA